MPALVGGLLIVLILGSGSVACRPGSSANPKSVGVEAASPDVAPPAAGGVARDASSTVRPDYASDVAPVLERRCVVCHGCYDAPCQLVLSEAAGIERGASKEAVYHAARLHEAPLTRLDEDATTVDAWRKKGFFSVMPDAEPSAASLMRALVELGRTHPPTPGAPLPVDVELDITRKLTCPTVDDADEYARANPHGGMPYGTAPLSRSEYETLASWLDAGGVTDPSPTLLNERVSRQVDAWEAFLNQDGLKEQITARYLYEHWFIAHLGFRTDPEGPVFRIVRSRTGPGEPIDSIATRRPFDSPGSDPFFYRLRPVTGAPLHKTRILYWLDEGRMARVRELFLGADWSPTELPGYDPKQAANPFVSFAEMPVSARYRFLLDDAQYFIMTFIRGPVCRGQVAVDVIEDRFFVMFVDPAHDLLSTQPELMDEVAEFLAMPAEYGSDWAPEMLWARYDAKQKRYRDLMQKGYDRADPAKQGPELDWIWDGGGGTNPNALLTVFRNFDNATVRRGFIGGPPETAWVIDYPVLERIYYDLVAGFDVFGNVSHQVSTRLYMNFLRMQAEEVFLGFLPPDVREPIRRSWYEGATRERKYRITDTNKKHVHGTRIVYETDDPKAELLERVATRTPSIAHSPDLLNACRAEPCDRPGATPLERSAERALRPLSQRRGGAIAALPEVTILRVQPSEPGDEPIVYTVVHNRAHTNVAHMFREGRRLQPEKDDVTLVRGYFASYPNFMLDVPELELSDFVDEMGASDGEAAWLRIVDRWGIRRSSPRFWPAMDWVRDDFARRDGPKAGILDLARYEDPRPAS